LRIICRRTKNTSPLPKPPVLKKLSGPELSVISITILHNGEKTELNNKQFETWGGTTLPNGTGNAILLSYGASNSKKNDASFSWMFTIPLAEKGTYTIGERPADGGPAPSLQFSTTLFPKIPMFICKSGNISITGCPTPGGFVTGSFSAILTGGVTSDGILDEGEYSVSGSFSILRQ
jgi:hypothetical protein